jgi:hypothetical protein
MRFVLGKGGSQYGSLRLHVDQLAAALTALGHEAQVVDMAADNGVAAVLLALSQPTDCFFAFNGVGCELAVDGRYFERPQFLYASMYVDHPVHHLSRLSNPIARQAVFFLDRTHVQFLTTWAGGAAGRGFAHVGFLPMGANTLAEPVDLSDAAFAARDIGVLFTGTYRGPPTQIWANWEPSAARDLVAETAERMAADGRLSLLDALRATLAPRRLPLSAELLESLAPLLSAAQMFAEASHRHALLTALGEAGTPVDVYGLGWEPLCARYPSFRHGGVGSFEETLHLLRRARLVLNSNNGFVAGGHERVFSAMSAGAAVFSDSSRYYAEAFKDDELATFSWAGLDLAPGALAALQADTGALAARARAGALRAQADHSWTARATKLVKAVEGLL